MTVCEVRLTYTISPAAGKSPVRTVDATKPVVEVVHLLPGRSGWIQTGSLDTFGDSFTGILVEHQGVKVLVGPHRSRGGAKVLAKRLVESPDGRHFIVTPHTTDQKVRGQREVPSYIRGRHRFWQMPRATFY